VLPLDESVVLVAVCPFAGLDAKNRIVTVATCRRVATSEGHAGWESGAISRRI
jgi:hypothetical protein